MIGAGAAGIMAAIWAVSSGAETVLVERTPDGGRKILISGGGRCNILPTRLDERRFITDSPPHLLRKVVRSWPLREQRAFFEQEAGLPLVEETESAKLFPVSQSARDVRDRLLALARERGATIVTGSRVTGFTPVDGAWRIEREDQEPLLAAALIVATGGLSIPSTGSDGAGLRLLERLGHVVEPPYAALTPLKADGARFRELAGISRPVTISARADHRAATASGGFLFTHRGYSGPAVLDISHVAVRSRIDGGSPARIVVRWTALDEQAWEASLRPRGNATVVSAVAAELPDRLARVLVDRAGIASGQTLSHLTREERRRLVDELVRGELPWTGDEGYGKAEVTGGGVNLAEIDPGTLESRRHRGLFLCGELLDAFGPIGGYNFYWAWATGRAAGRAAARFVAAAS